jgi:hypothetical protein
VNPPDEDRWDDPATGGTSATGAAGREARASSAADPGASAREFFRAFAWMGEAPDPEALSARDFLRWIA